MQQIRFTVAQFQTNIVASIAFLLAHLFFLKSQARISVIKNEVTI
ncbi:hypothetical protein J500_1991 [Acinetobacter sp. 479375]|nr:hypothetical protein J500_1991 [Acinetobacter sp. 479375]BBF77012.1 hypothetical protein URS_0986 [Acinetobacter ursingii]